MIAAVPIVSYVCIEVPADQFHDCIARHVEWLHKKAGMLSKARLVKKGADFGYAHALFKSKYFKGMSVDGGKMELHEKYLKGRPLQPGYTTVDRWIMGRFGKSLVWLTTLLPSTAMLLHATQDLVPGAQAFLESSVNKFGADGYRLEHMSFDIAGMYTVLTHKDIIAAVIWMLDVVAATHGAHGHVFHMPHKGRANPTWGKYNGEADMLELTFVEVMILTRISLATSFCWFGDGCLLQQVLGTPMGAMPSPGFAKCITAKSSYEWNVSMHADRRFLLHGTCFIDDLSIIIAMSVDADGGMRDAVAKMLHAYQHDVFPAGCVLELDEAGTYLETYMSVIDGDINIIHNSKNVACDVRRGKRAVMRLHHYHSHIPRSLKLGIVVGHICRILSNCIRPELVVEPLFDMMAEYEYLSYPVVVLLDACERVLSKQPHPGLKQVVRFVRSCV